MRKDVLKTMMFLNDVVLCKSNEVDMTEYLVMEKTLEDMGMRVSRPTHVGWNVGSNNRKR